MKHFLLSVFLLSVLYCSSQAFTNGSLYNYSVGDTIVTDHVQYLNNSPSPPKRTYRMFTQKSYSTNMDTIYYTVKDVVAQYSQCICPPVVTSNTSTLVISNLTLSAINFTLGTALPCTDEVDTSYVNSCGKYTHDKYSVIVTVTPGCEPDQISYRFIEGIGMFNKFISGHGLPGFGDETKLVNYHKVGQGPCAGSGVIGPLPTAINESSLKGQGIEIYPNPALGYVNLQNHTGSELSVYVKAIDGHQITEFKVGGDQTRLELPFAQGVYLLEVRNAKNEVVSIEKMLLVHR